ncbi:MAG: DUF6745 domain-containing protein [Nitrososphaerales archaeon]
MASVGNSVYGQHDANWLGFYDYFNNVIRLGRQTEKLKGLWMISQAAGWYIPHENICWISERHDVCKLNRSGKIHSEKGPAIHYPDGFSVYALNGIRVPQVLVDTEAEKLDPEMVLKEQNADIQREIIRKIGAERVLQKLNAVEVDKWTFKKFGLQYSLQKIKVNNLDANYLVYEAAMLKGVHYAKPMPPEVRTAMQGLAWMKHIIERNEIASTSAEALEAQLNKADWIC